jgi:hypothetical protein
MFRVLNVALVAFLALALAGQAAAAAGKPLKATNTWRGSVDDEKLKTECPENGVITNADDWKKLVKAWKVSDKVPEINFDKELIVIAVSVGSKLNLTASLDDKGDLKILGMGTRDIRPGFRYVICSVPNDGVKTVNGKPLKK